MWLVSQFVVCMSVHLRELPSDTDSSPSCHTRCEESLSQRGYVSVASPLSSSGSAGQLSSPHTLLFQEHKGPGYEPKPPWALGAWWPLGVKACTGGSPDPPSGVRSPLGVP